MKKLKNKTAAILIALFLTFSMTASMTLIPNANAHSPPWHIQTWAYLSVAPNPVGLGQTVYVTMWVDKPTPTGTSSPMSTFIYGDTLHNFTLTITDPAGTVSTVGPFIASYAAGYAYTYVPTMLGNYTFVFHFGGSQLVGENPPPSIPLTNAAYIGDYYDPSTSAVGTLTVQQQIIQSYPSNPLPTSYWSRPIEATGNLGWYQISGNWLGLASVEAVTGAYSNLENFNPYTTAPATAHILWTKPEAFGGVIGGEFGGSSSGGSYFAASHSDPKLAPVIINGILYYTDYPLSSASPEGWCAVNLQTGQSIWTQSPPYTTSVANNEVIKNGQTLIYTGLSQYGGTAYLWGSTGTTYSLYDPMTGSWVCNVTGTTFGTLTEDTHGDIIDYYVNATAGTETVNPSVGVSVVQTNTGPTLNCWNSTTCFLEYMYLLAPTTYSGGYFRITQGVNIPFSDGLQWSVPLATNITGGGSFSTLSISKVDTGATDSCSPPVVLMTSPSPNTFSSWNQGWQIEAGYNANTGAQLWITNRTLTTWGNTRLLCAQDGMYGEFCYETGAWTMYSMTTGQLLWGPVVSPAYNHWDEETGCNAIIAYGELIAVGFGGDVTGFNATNGNVLWTWSTPSSGSETVYGTYPLWVGYTLLPTVAGGEILIGGGHEYNVPLFQGSRLWAINTTDGKLIWSDLSFDVEAAPAVSDGILVDFNSYDCQIYAYGQGPSATTVTAPDIGVTTATPVTITGTVMDISAGSQQNAVAANFPHGLPCVSDASMTPWMEYVYQQQPMPTNATGVPVTLSVLDSNGNYRTIGTTTSNVYGTYSLTWTPDIPGNYTVIASFAGTQSYYPSSAATAFYASAPAPTAAPTATPAASVADTYFVPAIAGLFVLIIIVLAVVILSMLRKRP